MSQKLCFRFEVRVNLRGTYLPRASAPMTSAALEILLHVALTTALSLSFRLMLVYGDGWNSLEIYLNSLGSAVTPTGTDANCRVR